MNRLGFQIFVAGLAFLSQPAASTPRPLLYCSSAIVCMISGCVTPMPQSAYDPHFQDDSVVLGIGNKESLEPKFQDAYQEPHKKDQDRLEKRFIEDSLFVLSRFPPEILKEKRPILLGTSFDSRYFRGKNKKGWNVQIGLKYSEAHLIAHELGHSFDDDLSPSDRSRWDGEFGKYYLNSREPSQDYDVLSIPLETLKLGFVSEYAQQNRNEDFAETLASMILGKLPFSDYNFWIVYETNEKIRLKVDLIVSTLRRTAPHIDINTFKAMADWPDSAELKSLGILNSNSSPAAIRSAIEALPSRPKQTSKEELSDFILPEVLAKLIKDTTERNRVLNALPLSARQQLIQGLPLEP